MATAREHFDRFLITRHGRAEAILLSADEFEVLLDTLEILSDSKLVRRLSQGDEELEAEGGSTLEELRRELEDRGP